MTREAEADQQRFLQLAIVGAFPCLDEEMDRIGASAFAKRGGGFADELLIRVPQESGNE